MDQILQAPISRSQHHHPISLILLEICINLHPMVGATIWTNMDYITCMSCLQGLYSCNNAHAVSDYPSLIKGNSMGNRKRRGPSMVKEYNHRLSLLKVKDLDLGCLLRVTKSTSNIHRLKLKCIEQNMQSIDIGTEISTHVWIIELLLR